MAKTTSLPPPLPANSCLQQLSVVINLLFIWIFVAAFRSLAKFPSSRVTKKTPYGPSVNYLLEPCANQSCNQHTLFYVPTANDIIYLHLLPSFSSCITSPQPPEQARVADAGLCSVPRVHIGHMQSPDLNILRSCWRGRNKMDDMAATTVLHSEASQWRPNIQKSSKIFFISVPI